MTQPSSMMANDAEGKRPLIVCVLGMHRSGTSLVARILNLLGLELGPEAHLSVEPAPDNLRGFWEHREIVKLNDLILERLGGDWHSPPPFAAGWETSPALDSLKRRAEQLIGEDFADNDFWGWKDPRTCLTLPFWQRLLPPMHYVLCVRNPVDVAQSLKLRDGLPIEDGIELWFSYVSLALNDTAARPRHVVFYEDLLSDCQNEVARLGSFLGRADQARQADIQTRVKEFMEGSMQHHRTAPSDVLNAAGTTFHANALYVALRLGTAAQPNDQGHPSIDVDVQDFLNAFSQRCASEGRESSILQGQLEATSSQVEQLEQELGAVYNRRIWAWAERAARAHFALKRFFAFKWLYRGAYALAKRSLPLRLKRKLKARLFRAAAQTELSLDPLSISMPVASGTHPSRPRIPSHKLRSAFATIENSVNTQAIDLVALWLARSIIPRFLPFHTLDRFFQAWEKSGFHLTTNHYYSPIPDTGELQRNHKWDQESALVGVDLNEEYQLHLLNDVFPKFKAEYDRFPQGPSAGTQDFYLGNSRFGGTDALVLYCIARHFRPKRIVEVGIGYSTHLFSRAIQENGETSLTCIDPYPDEVATRLAAVSRLIEKPVQQVSLSVFEELGPNDICFIDTTHVVKTGGDVPFLYLEVLPRLKPGVLVHFHDIFMPKDYPKEWVLHHKRFWNEQYLLHGFLLFNHEFRVVFANSYMGVRYQSQLRKAFPNSPWWGGGSFWVQRRQQIASAQDGA